MSNRNYFVYIVCCLLVIPLACKKLIAVDTPANELPAEVVFGNDALADAAVADIYYILAGYYTSTTVPIINGMTADELMTINPPYLRYVNNAIPVDDALLLFSWRDFYKAIYRANAILEGLATASGISSTRVSQLSGEAKFLRAFCYYYLVNNWGDVPLITSTDVTKTAMAPRSPVAAVNAQVLADLQSAVTLLPESYSSTEKVRANKWAAVAMLARVSLQMGQWADAALNASHVINSGRYLPLSQPDSIFLKNSRSAILQIWVNDGFTFPGRTFLPVNNNSSNYPLSTDFINSFEPGDLRRAEWTGTFTYVGELYYYPYKYKNRTATTGDAGEYLMLLRIAEQYLIRAEALCRQGSVAAAVSDLNVIRQRSGLEDLPAGMSRDSCLLAIEQERRVELFTEWGDRWLSLKRNGRINTVLSVVKTNWKASAALYPIPQQERNTNPLLTQNEGYQR